MKEYNLSETQIVNMLSEAKAGIPIVDLCRKYQIANSTFYKLKNQFAGKNVADIRKLKDLEVDNRRFKKIYADFSLDHKILKDALEKMFSGLVEEK